MEATARCRGWANTGDKETSAHVKEIAGERIQKEAPKNIPWEKHISIKMVLGPERAKPA